MVFMNRHPGNMANVRLTLLANDAARVVTAATTSGGRWYETGPWSRETLSGLSLQPLAQLAFARTSLPSFEDSWSNAALIFARSASISGFIWAAFASPDFFRS